MEWRTSQCRAVLHRSPQQVSKTVEEAKQGSAWQLSTPSSSPCTWTHWGRSNPAEELQEGEIWGWLYVTWSVLFGGNWVPRVLLIPAGPCPINAPQLLTSSVQICSVHGLQAVHVAHGGYEWGPNRKAYSKHFKFFF